MGLCLCGVGTWVLRFTGGWYNIGFGLVLDCWTIVLVDLDMLAVGAFSLCELWGCLHVVLTFGVA